MKKQIIAALGVSIFVIAAAIVIGLLTSGTAPQAPADTPAPSLTPTPTPKITPPPGGFSDNQITLTLQLDDETVIEIALDTYLIGVVAAEAPASFEPAALAAQAVAARTYTLYQMYVAPRGDHPDANICSDSAHCQAYIDDSSLREKWGDDYYANIAKITDAVHETDGVYMTYNDAPILAAFHSSSGSVTESAADVWGRDLPYLVSVATPDNAFEIPNYITSVDVALSDFAETIQAFNSDVVFGEDAAAWFGPPVYDGADHVKMIDICGVTFSGAELRTLFGLRSTLFEISVSDSVITFTVTGYGHGVGMSQYGANSLAKMGASWREILLTYYVGVTFSDDEISIVDG